MKKFLSLSLALCVALLLALPVCAQEAGERAGTASPAFKIVVHKENAIDRLSPAQVSNFLLKKKTRWPDGSTVLPVDQEGRSQVRAALSQAVHERSVASIKNYWQRQIFSGHNTPPPELENDRAVLEFVGSNPGAIGYVDAGTALAKDVKAVQLDDSDD